MGSLIEYNDVYNAIQITSDKFGIAKQPVESAMRSMLSQIQPVAAIRIPENATNGDMLKAIFPHITVRDNCEQYYSVDVENISDDIGLNTIGFRKDWWNAPYMLDGVAYAVLLAGNKPVVWTPLPAQCQNEEENK